MQMFILDYNIEKNTQYYCDKHIVKIPTEIAQMISTVYHLQNMNIPEYLYKPTHINHPCNKWIRENINNFLYAVKLGKALYNEYQYRYNKPEKHARNKLIFDYTDKVLPSFSLGKLTPFALAIPDKYKTNDVVESYRHYYLREKSHLFKWTKREKPYWIKDELN